MADVDEVGGLLQEQLMVIEATNLHILARLENVEQCQVISLPPPPPIHPLTLHSRPDHLGSPIGQEEQQGYMPYSPVQDQANIELPAAFFQWKGPGT